MKTRLVAAAATALAFPAGHAFAAKMGGPAVAGPKQPIPYAELNAYMKASPKVRASKDWWSDQAADTGSAANTSATVAAPSPSLPSDTSSRSTTVNPVSPNNDEAKPLAIPSTPPIETPPSTTVNPPATTPPGAPPSAVPPR